MKFTVTQESFSKALNVASRFTTPKVQLPVLANILIVAEKDTLTISATNLEMSISMTVGSQIERPGSITIPARTLTDIVGNLHKGQITFEVTDTVLSISSKGFTGKVTGMSSDDFPALPHELGTSSVTMSAKELSDAFGKVLYAVSLDESRPILTGVLCIFNNDELMLVSTDGFRLSKTTVKIEGDIIERCIVPKAIVSEIIRSKEDGDVITFSYTKEENQLVCKIGNTILSSRLIDGNFPDFNRIIPKSSTISVTCDTSELLRAVKIASIFAKDSANVIKLKVGEDSLSVSADSSQKGNEETTIDAEISDSKEKSTEEEKKNDLVISFNCKFIEDFLSNTEADEVILSMTTPEAPAIIKNPKDENFLHIVMPIKIQG